MHAHKIYDLVVIGAGPHALACLSRLLEPVSSLYSEHDLATSRKYFKFSSQGVHDFVVVDPAGESWLEAARTVLQAVPSEVQGLFFVLTRLGTWLSNWDKLMQNTCVKTLRSHMLGTIFPMFNDLFLL